MESEEGFVYTINGVKVIFPCKAYPTQLCMMDKIIKGVERQQNCLLESPTGSGKSLALLCSSLAWQAAEYDKKAKMDNKMIEEALDDECCPTSCLTGEKNPLSTGPIIVEPPPVVIEKDQNNHIETINLVDSKAADAFHVPIPSSVTLSPNPTDDDFQPLKKRFRTPGNQQPATKSVKRRRVQTPQNLSIEDEDDREPPEWTIELTAADGSGAKDSVSPGALDGCEMKEKCSPNDESKDKGNSEKIKVPKIFFGTRTHKQIAQITRELGKTLYKRARMSILSSREHSCVHPVVSNNTNKNEACKKLLDGLEGGTCKYYQKVHTMRTQASIRFHGLDAAWDIEDLVTLGNRIKACPYYAARELMKEADIIFCPYNYLIDPKIRRQMEIDLKDQILVLDEAHNVEDSARDAASFTINAVELQEVLDDLDKMVSFGVLPEHHRSLHILVANLLRWIHVSSTQLIERGFEQSSKVWAGMEIVTALEEQGMTPATFFIHWEHFELILASLKDPNRHSPSLSSQSLSRLEGIFLVAQFMLGKEMKYISDYRVAILKTAVMVRNESLGGGWRRSHGGMRKEWTHSLNFWCLNPAVVFSELGSVTRCIILTSGTLSPIASFSSELGIAFPIQLEANHVIANSQIWVGTLSTGPNGSAVNASYHSAETFMFQDEVGRMILRVCETVPHGVLCFFPSYNMLDKLSKRWQTTGLWSQLLDKKDIVSEPRSGDKSEFDDIMHQFYHAVRISEDEEHNEEDSEDGSSVDGGLFLAVCRGKVSEGLDFADNNARAVITIGIPFPNVKDVQVELKRKYNNFYASRRGLLTGSEWYEIQAYRALNQALGRCIRHKKDWGAILLIDERFNKSPKYTNGISKWVRHRIMRFYDFQAAMSSLKDFASARKMEPCPTIAATPHSLSQQTKSTLATPTRELCITLGAVDKQHTYGKPSMESLPLHTPQGNRVVPVPQVQSAGNLTVLDACNVTPKILCFQANEKGTNDGFKAKTADSNSNETKSLHSEALVLDSGNVEEGSTRNETVEKSEFCASKTCDREAPSELSSSPLLFSTPCSTPSPSPVTELEFKESACATKGTNLCPITDNHDGRNKCIDKLTEFVYRKRIDSKESEIVKDGVVSKEPIGAFDKSNKVAKHSVVKDAASTVRKLFKNRAVSVSDAKQEDHGCETKNPRDIAPDDKKENPAIESVNCAQTATLENVFPERNSGEKQQQSKLAPKSEPVLRSNLRRSQRKKTRRNSTTEEGYALREKVDQEDRSPSLFCCSHCTTDLLTGHFTRESFPRPLLDELSGSAVATLNGGTVLRADKQTSQTLNLCPLVDIKSEKSSGFKLDSFYVPDVECCCIPQVCRVCSANGKSKVVGVEVISFKATSEQELSQPLPVKQVWLFENLVTSSKRH